MYNVFTIKALLLRVKDAELNKICDWLRRVWDD